MTTPEKIRLVAKLIINMPDPELYTKFVYPTEVARVAELIADGTIAHGSANIIFRELYGQRA